MSDSAVQVQDTTANPAPLGLMGFGMTTVLLNIHNAGFFPLAGMILGMGIFVGGFAQIIAGIMEWKKGNTFGATAFSLYGVFWLSLVASIVLPTRDGLEAAGGPAMATYLLIWGIFTLVMAIGTLRLTRHLQIVFFSLALLFFLLAAGDYSGSTMITRIAGFEGIFCGASAIYAALYLVLKEIYAS